MSTSVRIPLPPSNNHYKRHYCSVDSSHPVRAMLTPATKVFKNEAGWMAKEQGVRMSENPVVIRMVAYMARDKHGKPKPYDADNLTKVVFDCLQGIAYENDSQIKSYSVTVEHIPHGQSSYMELQISDYMPNMW